MKKEFNLDKLKTLNISKGQEYIKKYFVPLRNGEHAVFMEGKFTIMKQEAVKQTYFNRMSVEINKWYFTTYTDVRFITYQLNKELMFDDKLNLCPPWMHEKQKYDDFSTEIKAKVDIMMNYIFEILANKNKDHFDYLLKWIANMLQGNKNNSCLYLRGEQGVGKSTLFSFLRKHVIGKELCIETGSTPLKSDFNACLAGKLLVIFEELETFSVSEWSAISSRLKRYITSDVIAIADKHIKQYDAPNLNNYVICSNNDAIKDDDGRRYFILDIATHRTKDRPFWDNLYNNCFNDEIGHAFYCKLNEITTTNFNPQNFPMTQSKLDSFAKRLEIHEQFIKAHYVLRKRDILCTVEEFYCEFKAFCADHDHKVYSKIILGRKLDSLNIKYYKSNEVNKYRVKYNELQAIADDRHWIHELDDYKQPRGIDIDVSESSNTLDEERKKNSELTQKYEKLQQEMEDLKKKFAAKFFEDLHAAKAAEVAKQPKSLLSSFLDNAETVEMKKTSKKNKK